MSVSTLETWTFASHEVVGSRIIAPIAFASNRDCVRTLDTPTAIGVLRETGSAILPLSHSLEPRDLPNLEQAPVPDELVAFMIEQGTKPLLVANTSRATTSRRTIELGIACANAIGTNVIKAETLLEARLPSGQYTIVPDRNGVLSATKTLASEGYDVAPLVPADQATIEEALSIPGVQTLRLYLGYIGLGEGPFVSDDTLADIICNRPEGVTYIAEGGFGTPEHVRRVMALGFDATLINAAITTAVDPISTSKSMFGASIAGRETYLRSL